MFKSIGRKVYSFDLEWVPDTRAGRLLLGLSDATPELKVWEAMWKAAGGTDENPRPFIKTIQSRIVSVAAVIRQENDKGEVTLRLTSLPKNPENEAERNEAAILKIFLDALGEHKPQIVGFYSGNADIPILVQRSIINGLHAPGFASRPDKPWNGVDYFDHRNSEGHIDISTVGSAYKNTYTLNEMATLSGIPGKLGVAGGDVAQMWLDGKYSDICHYNQTDAITTYLTWLRIAHFGGFFNDANYQVEQQRVFDLINSEIKRGGKHLKAFLDAWSFKGAVKPA